MFRRRYFPRDIKFTNVLSRQIRLCKDLRPVPPDIYFFDLEAVISTARKRGGDENSSKDHASGRYGGTEASRRSDGGYAGEEEVDGNKMAEHSLTDDQRISRSFFKCVSRNWRDEFSHFTLYENPRDESPPEDTSREASQHVQRGHAGWRGVANLRTRLSAIVYCWCLIAEGSLFNKTCLKCPNDIRAFARILGFIVECGD